MANRSTRKMIQVDTVKCDGCGVCIPACPEGALQIIDGKARLVRQSYCDGLGACLGDCPQGALAVVEVEADVYDEAAVIAHLQQTGPELVTRHIAHLQAHAGELRPPLGQVAPVSPCLPVPVDLRDAAQSAAPAPSVPSELRQWPVQLRLLPVRAPFFDEVCLTLIADCVPFAYPNMHADFMRGDTIAVGCPKLDDPAAYFEKLTLMLQENDIRALKVVYMEVPCCRGLVRIAQQALERSGRDIPFDSVMVAIRG